MDWSYLFEISLTGIASGGLYALAALAFVMVYKATRVVNIAIGEMLMAGAYLFLTFAASSSTAPCPRRAASASTRSTSSGSAARASSRPSR